MSCPKPFVALAPFLILALAVSPARAEPWFGWGRGGIEDRFASGDVDVEDLLADAGSSRAGTTRGRSPGDAVHAGTWVSLGGFWRVFEGGYQDAGVLVIAGIAFDKLEAGRAPEARSLREGSAKTSPVSQGPDPPRPSPAPLVPPPPEVEESLRVLVTPGVARSAVVAAWRTAGLGVDDKRIDSMVARARASAALPEARFRAMRVFLLDGSESSVVPIDTSTYASAAATLVLEGRLTWRLDRLLYADDEPTLERLRLERQDARSKVAGRVLDALFQWQRAWFAVRAAKPGSRESTEATMRLIEAAAGLEVMTGGWFAAWTAEVREDRAGDAP